MLLPEFIEELFPLISGSLFYCSNDVDPMHFVLSLKNLTEEENDRLIVLMRHAGAQISFDLEEATDYAAIIVDHNDVVKFHGPAFSVQFIELCLRNAKLYDVSQYRQNATEHIAAGYDCMSVVYFRKKSWKSIITEKEKHWIDSHAVDCCDSETQRDHSLSSLDDDVEGDPLRFGSRFAASTDNDETIAKRAVEVKPSPRNKKNVVKKDKKTSENPKSNEDALSDDTDSESVISFSGRSTNANDDVMEMNQRTNEAVNKATNTAVFSGKELAERINTALKETQITQKAASANPPSSHSSQTKKWEFLDDFIESKSSDEEQANNPNNQEFLDDFEPESMDEDRPVKPRKRSRMPYSSDERSNILKYIVNHNEYGRVKGKELWIIMERRKLCPSRTWQSMKEHFIKKIIFDLDEFSFLTSDQINRIKRVCF